MAKGGKSSASSATRKKQAAKAAKKAGVDAPPPPAAAAAAAAAKQQQRGQKKDKKKDKKAPKKKVFIPPPKPPQPAPDPLDALGLAAHLPSDLVVHLRKASKKDVLTRQRALEGLQAWVRGEPNDEPAGGTTLSEEERNSALTLMLPSWVHIFPRLSISPTRRLRVLTAQILTELLAIPDVRAELLFSPQYAEALIGPWAVLAWDTDRHTSRIAREAWDRSLSWNSNETAEVSTSASNNAKLNITDQLPALLSHLSILLLTLSPSTVLAHNAPHVPTPAAVSSAAGQLNTNLGPDASLRDAKNRDDTVEEDVAATDRRLAAGALGSLAWIVASHPAPMLGDETDVEGSSQQLLLRLLSSPSLWSNLAPIQFDAGGASDEDQHQAALPLLGLASPPTRQRAWDLLKALVQADTELVKQHVLSIVAPIALVSAWEEKDQLVQKNMLVTLLPLLRALPETWISADHALGGGEGRDEDDQDEEEEEDDDEDEEEDEEDDADQVAASAARRKSVQINNSPTFTAFQTWIRTGCAGAPETCYPTVVLFLATVPISILPTTSLAFSQFLTGFGQALFPLSPALESRLAMAAYISAFCDCVTYLTHRLLKSESSSVGEAADLASAQLGALWAAVILGGESGTSSVENSSRVLGFVSERVLQPFVSCIEQLANLGKAGPELAVAALKRVSEQTLAQVSDSGLSTADMQSLLSRAAGPLEKLHRSAKIARAAAEPISSLALTFADQTIQRLTAAGQKEEARDSRALVIILSDLLKRFPAVIADSEDVSTRAIQLGSDRIPALFADGTISARETIAALAALSAISERAATAMRDIWSRMVQVVLQLPDAGSQAGAVVELLPAVKGLGSGSNGEQESLTPALRTALSDIAVALTQKLCEGQVAATEHRTELARAIGGIVALPPSHVDAEPLAEALALLTSLIEHVGMNALRSAATAKADSGPSSPVEAETETSNSTQLPYALGVLASWLKGESSAEAKQMMHAGEAWSVVPVIFALAQPPQGGRQLSGSVQSEAGQVWESLRSDPQAIESVDAFVRRQVEDTSFAVEDVLRLARVASLDAAEAEEDEKKKAAHLFRLLPSKDELDSAAAAAVRSGHSLAILGVVDGLVPLGASESESSESSGAARVFDHQGHSAYARSVLAHSGLCDDDRKVRSRSVWLLPHLIRLGLFAEDRLLHGKSWPSVLSPNASTATIRRTLDRCIKTSTTILSGLATGLTADWHTAVTAELAGTTSKTPASDPAGFADAVRQAFTLAKGSNTSAHYRVLARFLSGILTFSSAERPDAERWLRLGQQVQASDGQLTQAIYLSAKTLALGLPLYERLCNEAAARLAGVPPSKASTEGLGLLRVANAIAPPLSSDSAFLPQQRAIFLLQALQKWIASEEDLDEEINTQLARLFVHLVPIVQGMSGSHLDFFFDVIESNLDLAVETVEEDDGIPAAFYTLKLLDTVMDLASANAVLREVYSARQAGITELVSKLFVGLAPSATTSARLHSVPREICNNLLVDLIHRIPESQRASLVNNTEVLAALLGHRAQQVQVISYRLLSAYVHQRVQDAVVEAAVDKEGATQYEILPELLSTASRTPAEVVAQLDRPATHHAVFGFLLTWLAVLDHFEEGSLQLKSVYVAQLQKSDMAASSLFPAIFAIFAATQQSQPYNASRFAVDEIFLDDLELSRVPTLQALAGHVFYRALVHLPSLVRTWWYSIKDRQLSMQVAAFTSRHCSPLLAGKELAHLRQPDALSQLQDESLAVKVLSGTNEVVATYTVDEHPMEIGIRLPQDYPLHGAEIRDIKRLGGVSEGQWRAWLLAVQQLISSRNGLVFDAIMLFKKNAEAKFSGFEGRECAICYSIISPTDETLPTKPCKTCKNSFHSSCLLKWVVQSGSSTCPLCRSII
ncbi:hypothetical protein OC846_004159 [Tilletia horrida]|uniref:E3 ubiquitin-protein ligase listerin n=1 Tax=Tilletia horrida TaxID=155126 RepID=A0AAN6JX96_9BASI|nr:hypothetical protein OC845_004353 [Tilletia horrida]KAK0549263.1 hypothetical protein OC846_004159 [Tilletia horrida]